MSTPPSSPVSDEVRRLRWRCRRGMRELDVLLTRYLNSEFEGATEQTQRDFSYLLEQEDDQLWDWLLGRSSPDDPRLVAIVAEVTAQPTDASASP